MYLFHYYSLIFNLIVKISVVIFINLVVVILFYFINLKIIECLMFNLIISLIITI